MKTPTCSRRNSAVPLRYQQLKVITINIPDQYLECIEVMVNLGFFPSRSEAIRQALSRFLVMERGVNYDLEPDHFQALKEEQITGMMNLCE